jgi:anti-sigma factor RsiW
MTCAQLVDCLDAYVDRELDGATEMAVREHLENCSGCRRLVAERETLSRLVRSVPYYSAPDRVRARVTSSARRRLSVRQLATWAAAAVLVVALGAGIRRVPLQTRSDAMTEAVVDGHVRSLMAEHLFDVRSTDQHTVKPWFLGRIDFSPPVVDLAALGFPLVGGRLDYLDGRPVAALVYQRQKHTINVFIAPDDDGNGTGVDARSMRGFHVHHWIRAGMSFWVVSDLNEAELTQFANALRQS